jgi:hypothetical protein
MLLQESNRCSKKIHNAIFNKGFIYFDACVTSVNLKKASDSSLYVVLVAFLYGKNGLWLFPNLFSREQDSYSVAIIPQSHLCSIQHCRIL